jgi:hypothetical protein
MPSILRSVLLWGTVIGLIHFVFIGFLYGVPPIRKLYASAQQTDPGVRRWDSRPRYVFTQFLGTQVEVFILTLAFFALRGLFPGRILLLALLLAAVRVYPRFWNMWIQSTYPGRLLAVEAINGTLGTLAVVCGLSWLT